MLLPHVIYCCQIVLIATSRDLEIRYELLQEFLFRLATDFEKVFSMFETNMPPFADLIMRILREV